MKEERPAMLPRRGPQPAADELMDPVDVVKPVASTAPAGARPPVASPVASASVAARGRSKKREVTLPLGNRINKEVFDLLDEATEVAGSQRAALEEAITNYWGPKLNRR